VRAARPLVIAGAAWVALVALMAQAGFSGEQRYLLPGVALLSIAGAAGWWKLSTYAGLNFPHPSKVVTPILAIAIAVAAAPRIADLPDLRAAQLHQRALARDLDRAIARAGGPAAVRACGTPVRRPAARAADGLPP
jgi:hypothetical protein